MADKGKINSTNGSNKSGPRGLVQGLPVLLYDERANMGMRVNYWCEKLMIHVRSGDYYPNMDNIFRADNPAYPEIQEPEEPEPAAGAVGISKIQEIRYGKEFDMYLKNVERFNHDKIKIHGLMMGQSGDSSKNQTKTTSEGIKAVDEEKDPLKLVKAIRGTHMTYSLVDPKIAFFAAQSLYEQTRMGDKESLARHKEVLESAHSRLVSAAEAAKESYPTETFDVPSASMLAVKFVMTLSSRYGAYKQKVTRGEKHIPATIKDALEDVQKHGAEYARLVGDRQVEQVNVTTSSKRPGGGEAVKNPIPGVDGVILPKIKCLFKECGQFGHKANMCPLKSAKRAEQMGEDEKSIEQAVKSVTMEFQKVGKGGLKAGGGAAHSK